MPQPETRSARLSGPGRSRPRIPSWLTARRVSVIDTLSIALCTVAVILRFMELHTVLSPDVAPSLGVLHAALPHAPPSNYGWWSWWDQSWYLQAALAWSHLYLDPAMHWYPPGYPMLGALFTRVTPADPFMVPDLACMVAALWLFTAISGHLFGRAQLGRSVGAWLFLASNAAPKLVVWAWVVPWTTTPETVLLFACLLGTIRFAAGLRPADAALAGFAAAATVAFRPADAAAVGGLCAAAATAALLLHWPGWPRAARIVAAALAGAALPLVFYGSAYLAVNGPHLDDYLATSAAYGFEWRLLPLRWVTVMVDPRPLFTDGHGLAEAFPWIVSGLAGMAACILLRLGPATRLVHAAVIAAVLADTVLFVCYRDLHPDFIWQNGIYHYFKWTLPVFALYSALLLRALLAGPRLVPALATAAVVLALFMWRVQVTDATPLALPLDERTLALPHSLSRLDDVLFARTAPNETVFVPFGAEIRTGPQVFRGVFDFKLTPSSEMLMVQPLRTMPDAPGTLVLARDTYHLDLATAPVIARTTAAWAIPCWLRPERKACRSAFLLPAPMLPLGKTVHFGTDGDGELYRMAGLAYPEAGGDWTIGSRATLAFHLPESSRNQPVALEITAAGFVPLEEPSRITAYANGVQIGRWRFPRGESTALSAIPPAAMHPDGNILLDLVVANPRSPSHYAKTPDSRELGIQLHTMRIKPVE